MPGFTSHESHEFMIKLNYLDLPNLAIDLGFAETIDHTFSPSWEFHERVQLTQKLRSAWS